MAPTLKASDTISAMIVRHGFSTVVALGAFAVIVVFLLQPQAAERKILLESIQESVANSKETADSVRKSNESIAQSTATIATSVQQTQGTLRQVDETMRTMDGTLTKLDGCMTKFSGEMREVHDGMSEKLNKIDEHTTDGS